ncbi:protoporphyrinogen oxidase [Mycotypha africana]|uniref:protoporphyrinogen oxidase n=1 Tax=Mycotypha africana TaxID=64632 RepID=UPI0023000167|nr:protoporphyrinogen oxidase [Mycotypha africana]KAI8988420.1 protoporphyrinogen oxidase [Mycotypha africana]
MTVAILGGGISGLSAAYYLARFAPPTTKILLIEGKNRVGGWIQSQRVAPGNYDFKNNMPQESEDKDDILFESGARSLRPKGVNGAIMLEMIHHLKLHEDDNLLCVPKTDPSAQHRYIYYKDKINTVPTGIASLLTHKPPPVFKSVISAGILELFRPSRFNSQGELKDPNGADETIYAFMKRRFNEHTAINLLGALGHGIYAGDIKELSVKSTMRFLYEAERVHGSVVKSMILGNKNTGSMRERGLAVRSRNADPEWFGKMEKNSVIGFRDGLESLPRKLRAWLENCPNVEILTGEPVESIQTVSHDQEIKIKTKSKDIFAEHVISTLPSIDLKKTLQQKPLPHLCHNPSVDVAVVNMAYSPEEATLKYDGFGFLTPHRDTKYPMPLPGTLGVIFDSNALKGQDTKKCVKLTAMMGGSDWKDAFGNVPIDQLDPKDAYDYARKVMDTYLGIRADPTHSLVNLSKQCIPQYLVGHESRMLELHHAVKANYGHLMSLTGASYLGPSVPDCIKHSRMLVEELLVSGALATDKSRRQKVVTGLGKTVEGNNTDEIKDSERISKGNLNVIMNA